MRAVNAEFVDTYQLKSLSQIIEVSHNPAHSDQYRLRITKDEQGGLYVNHGSIAAEIGPFDRVIACTGFRFDSDIFRGGNMGFMEIMHGKHAKDLKKMEL